MCTARYSITDAWVGGKNSFELGRNYRVWLLLGKLTSAWWAISSWVRRIATPTGRRRGFSTWSGSRFSSAFAAGTRGLCERRLFLTASRRSRRIGGVWLLART